jgi:hypothetical protein
MKFAYKKVSCGGLNGKEAEEGLHGPGQVQRICHFPFHQVPVVYLSVLVPSTLPYTGRCQGQAYWGSSFTRKAMSCLGERAECFGSEFRTEGSGLMPPNARHADFQEI